jgi:hypothetical protein
VTLEQTEPCTQDFDRCFDENAGLLAQHESVLSHTCLLLMLRLLLQIHEALIPDAAAVRADLYKLNIMGPGGFFKPHKDTPRGGETCFGTLVVCLPLPFSGTQITELS